MSVRQWGSLTPQDVDRLTVEVLRTAWRARPEVRRIRLGGQDAVVKDYGRGGNLFKRAVLGSFLAQREAAALRRAEGIANVPELLGMPRPWMVILTYIDARGVTEVEEGELAAEFFDRLEGLITRLHERGIAHGDLEKLDNILVTADGEPVLVDFAAAIMAGANPLAALVLPYIRDNDWRAVCKLKERVAPHLLTEEEREKLNARPTAERWFRGVRGYIRRPIKSLATGEDEPAGG
ncbi:MAG: RIO1 family regulatory kinase/ATPase [Armatimonadota bacterium]